MPIGIHHLFADPQVGRRIQVRARGDDGDGLGADAADGVHDRRLGRDRGPVARRPRRLRWVRALPWDNPMMLAVTFSFVMLGFGGAGGIINMSYQLNETIHNTQWVTGHFHLIFGGAIVLMYFMAAYELWPQLTGCAPIAARLVKLQIWSWFLGMLVLSMPWHLVGLLGMPRRMAYYDYTHPDIAPQAWTVTVSAIGGFVLLASGIVFIYALATAGRRKAVTVEPFTFSRAAHPGGRTPLALNGFALWIAMMIGLTVVNYGYPIFQLASLKQAYVPVIPIGSR
jgi:cytochrome c oxidase subunit 1